MEQEIWQRPWHHAIIDDGNDTLVALGTQLSSLAFVNESLMDTSLVFNIAPSEVRKIKSSGPESYPEWSWDSVRKGFKKTNPAILTKDAAERSELAAKKIEAIAWVKFIINTQRAKMNTGVFFQDRIYAEKERQALRLKEGGFENALAPEVPYVSQYAADNAISLKQATEEILLQAKLDHEFLAKTERTRLALFRKLRLAKKPAEVDVLLERYRTTGVI